MYTAAEIVGGGLSGGLGSVIAGGYFWRGAEQGVIATAYNHAVHGLYNKITQDSKSPYDGYRKDKNGNYIRVDGRGGDKIDYLYDEEGNIIASTPVSFTEIEVGPYRRTYGQGTKYVSPALYDPSFDIFAWWASGEVLGAAVVKVYRYLSGVGRVAKVLKPLGLGSTGRTVANNLTEQLAMKEIMSNPTAGKVIMEGLKDSRWTGWSKMQYIHKGLNGSKTTIHYVGKWEKGILKAVDDFKFK